MAAKKRFTLSAASNASGVKKRFTLSAGEAEVKTAHEVQRADGAKLTKVAT